MEFSLSSEGSSGPPVVFRSGRHILNRQTLATFSSPLISRHHADLVVANDFATAEVTARGMNPIVVWHGGEEKSTVVRKDETVTVMSGDVIQLYPGAPRLKAVIAMGAAEDSDVIRESDLSSEERATVQASKRRKTVAVKTPARAESSSAGREVITLSDSDENRQSPLIRSTADIPEVHAAHTDSKRPVQAAGGSSKRVSKSDSSDSDDGDRVGVVDKEGVIDGITRAHVTRLPFRMARTRAVLPQANVGAVSVAELLQGNITAVFLCNYEVDAAYMTQQCPVLLTVPVTVIHGERYSGLEALNAEKPNNWQLYYPRNILQFGTHHSKMILAYMEGPPRLRVVITTSNFVMSDWHHKTQGVYIEEFPLKAAGAQASSCEYEDYLSEYLDYIKGPASTHARRIRQYDFSNARVALVASVPGFHQGSSLEKWGHMRLRSLLQREAIPDEFTKAIPLCQFSSMGSVDAKWLNEEFNSSLCASQTRRIASLQPPKLVFPTVEAVRNSIEGYAAGGSIPVHSKNLRPHITSLMYKWEGPHSHRSQAMPHIKTYTRAVTNPVTRTVDLAWFLLTSANLSKAAWGALTKNGTQLMIRSYEIGVLYLPSRFGSRFIAGWPLSAPQWHNDCTSPPKGSTSAGNSSGGGSSASSSAVTAPSSAAQSMLFPVPHIIPPVKYGAGDVPWSVDGTYLKPDIHGRVWDRS